MIARYDIYSDGGDYGSSPLIKMRDTEGKWVMFEDVELEINSWKSKAQKWEQDLGVAKSKYFKLDAKVSTLEAEVERLTKSHDHQYNMAGLMLREAEKAHQEIDQLNERIDEYLTSLYSFGGLDYRDPVIIEWLNKKGL
jgi:chromosome segregation ATPase